MDLSLFFAKLFGFYFLIVGIIVLLRRDEFIPAIRGFIKEQPLLICVAFIEIIAGLAILLTHHILTPDFRMAITLIGYWIVVEGILYLLLSKKVMAKLIRVFNKPSMYVASGIICIVFGGWLLSQGFAAF